MPNRVIDKTKFGQFYYMYTYLVKYSKVWNWSDNFIAKNPSTNSAWNLQHMMRLPVRAKTSYEQEVTYCHPHARVKFEPLLSFYLFWLKHRHFLDIYHTQFIKMECEFKKRDSRIISHINWELQTSFR
jgi:hypothetical protein